MAHVFRLFLGNPDIMFTVITWIIFSVLLLSIVQVREDMNQ